MCQKHRNHIVKTYFQRSFEFLKKVSFIKKNSKSFKTLASKKKKQNDGQKNHRVTYTLL